MPKYDKTQHTVLTPFKFAAIKIWGFDMTYSRPFNFAVSYQNYFKVSYTNVVFLWLEHKLGLMEILNNLKRNMFCEKKRLVFFVEKKIYSRPFNFANLGFSRNSQN